MQLLIGIDDKDNLESHGTGHRVRQLVERLAEDHLTEPMGITHHQLFVDAYIPYTSHNSSACLSVETDEVENVWKASRDFLLLLPGDNPYTWLFYMLPDPVLDLAFRYLPSLTNKV